MTIGEVLIASAITLTLMGTVLGITAPLQRIFDTQLAPLLARRGFAALQRLGRAALQL